MATVSLDKIVSTFIKIRDKRAADKRAWEEGDKLLAGKMEQLEAFLNGHMNDTGVESFRTEHGTVYQTIDVIPNANDWDLFYRWIAENNAFDALERRIKKTFIGDYMEQNKGKLPPGVSTFRKLKVNIRRS